MQAGKIHRVCTELAGCVAYTSLDSFSRAARTSCVGMRYVLLITRPIALSV